MAPALLVAAALLCQGAEPTVNPSEPSFTNHLAGEKSPYLLQHEHNPVDWYPWGPEAFDKARREKKPIFLSVGYSTCHWCHVMAHESFENPEIAAIMNRLFVNIKVDREERPDVDRVYMAYVQATTGSGGWPMSVFLTPDRKPFYGGTYFPPDDRYGRPGFPRLLEGVAGAWEKDHENVLENADKAVAVLREMSANSRPSHGMGREDVLHCYSQLARAFDPELGGFGGAPKFPHPVSLDLLFRVRARFGADSEEGRHAMEMALLTLEKMAAGGMHDQLGGGFHRYSVDRFWHVPHFEKMLYDQAQLACSYMDAFQLTHDPAWERTARDILDYVARDLTAKEGGFFSAEDADSLLEKGKPEHAEGAFYVWTRDEIERELPESAVRLFCSAYGVEAEGNSPPGSDPHREFEGKNTLLKRMTASVAAKAVGFPEADAGIALAHCREKLLAIRSARPRPHLDDKIITAWNGLMISAFARGGLTFDDAGYRCSAQRSAAFVRANLWKDGRLLRSYRGAPGAVPAFADDYASLIQGLLDLYEADFDVSHLQWALELQAAMDALFWDEESGGYFSSAGGDESILLRMKEDYDGAEPSPNSTAALNLARLAQIVDSEEFKKREAAIASAFSARLSDSPSSMPQLLCAVADRLKGARQIVIAGAPDDMGTHALVRQVAGCYLPGTILLLADQALGQAWLAKRLPFIEGMKPIGGKPAAYVCENYACSLPVTDPEGLRAILQK